MLPFWVHGQSVYEHVKSEYNTENSISVINVSKEDLEQDGIKGNRLYFALSRVALANYKHREYLAAKEVLDSIPVDSITFDQTLYDVVFTKALIEQSLGNYIAAHKIYSEWLPQVPNEYHKLLAIHYNNYATVLKYFGNHVAYKEALYVALENAQQLDDSDSQKRINLIAKNISNQSLSEGRIKEAKEYHSMIDTTGMDAEGLATYFLSIGNIQEAEKKFQAAGIAFINARDLANKFNDRNIVEIASSSLLRTSTKLEIQRRNQKVGKWIGVFFAILAIIGLLFLPGYLKKERAKTINEFQDLINNI